MHARHSRTILPIGAPQGAPFFIPCHSHMAARWRGNFDARPISCEKDDSFLSASAGLHDVPLNDIHLFFLAIYKISPKSAFLARYLLCIWKTVFPTAISTP